MKIAYFVPYITQSGPLNVVKYLCQELKKEHEVDVYYFKDIHTIQFPVKTEQISFFDMINFDKYDILHSHGFIPDAYLWWHTKDIEKAHSVTTLHNYIKEDSKYAYNPLKAFLLQRVWNQVTSRHDRVVTLSHDAVEYYKKFWINQNLTAVSSGIPKDKVSRDRVNKEDASFIHIGMIGSSRISKIKGFDQAIRALKRLPNYTLSIAGGGSEVENLRQLAEELEVDDRVHFMGFQKDIRSFIASMDLFVVPSRSEGFSLALQEIVRGKKPVACSNIPIFHELFSHEEIGFFDLDDSESFENTVQRVWREREQLVQVAYKRFERNYTIDIMAKSYLKVYQDLRDHEVSRSV